MGAGAPTIRTFAVDFGHDPIVHCSRPACSATNRLPHQRRTKPFEERSAAAWPAPRFRYYVDGWAFSPRSRTALLAGSGAVAQVHG
jgi:hypothetical protein